MLGHGAELAASALSSRHTGSQQPGQASVLGGQAETSWSLGSAGAGSRPHPLQLLLELLDARSQATALKCELCLSAPTPTSQASCARPTTAPLPARRVLCAHPLIRFTQALKREGRVKDQLSCACWSAADIAHRHCSSTACMAGPGCQLLPVAKPAWACAAVLWHKHLVLLDPSALPGHLQQKVPGRHHL